MPKFKVGDRVKIKDSVPVDDLIGTMLYDLEEDCIATIDEVDGELWSASDGADYNDDFVYKTGPVGFHVPESFLELVATAQKTKTPQQHLDMLAKYFTSGNDVPVKQATIKASDFWKIYNGEV